jgi:tetratricopeptide (TPR) repeat protein
MKKRILYLGTIVFLLSGLAFVSLVSLLPGVVDGMEDEEPELISPLGKKLYARPATGEELASLNNDLKVATEKFKANPEAPENIIMVGRRLAYLWKYREAITMYTKGIAKYPDNAMLYRHRGHRFISTRQYDKAVADLEKASQLNDHDFDIWYHLGLAYYLRGEFGQAHRAYKECLATAEDDDSKLAISNWLYITLRRLGKKAEARKVLDSITGGMEVVENQSYYSLLYLYRGRKSVDEVEKEATSSDLELATMGYGIGAWYLYNGKTEKAKDVFNKIVNTNYWPAFGYIAAEAELVRMTK